MALAGQKAHFRLREAGAKDSAGILACLGAAFQSYRADYTPEAFADTVLDSQTIQHRLQRMRVFVAVAGNEVVGTIACEAHGAEGHLRGMAVCPEWQGVGLAPALLRTAEDQLRKDGCIHVTLDTTEPLKRAIRFYEKHGFSASGKVSDFFGMPLFQYSKPL